MAKHDKYMRTGEKRSDPREIGVPLGSRVIDIDRIMSQTPNGTTIITHDSSGENKALTLLRRKYRGRNLRVIKRAAR